MVFNEERNPSGIVAFIPSRDEKGRGITYVNHEKQAKMRNEALVVGEHGLSTVRNNSKRRRIAKIIKEMM